MGILVVGLLSVMSMLPAGGKYMQQGEIADRGSAIAQAAFADLVTRGMLNPDAWLMYEKSNSINPPELRNKFSKQFGSELRKRIADYSFSPMYATSYQNGTVAQGPDQAPLNAAGQIRLNQDFGAIYIIDPMNASSLETVNVNQRKGWSAFPFMTQDGWNALSGSAYMSATFWNPWKPTGSGNEGWPIVRVTLPVPEYDTATTPDYQPMGREISRQLFSSQADLVIDLPAAKDDPSQQPWDLVSLSGGEVPTTRQWKGDYSWIVTVEPTTVEARNALAKPDANSYEYDVSVVVFHKRVLDTITVQGSGVADDVLESELMAMAAVKSTGLSGGEMLLTANPLLSGSLAAQPFNKLKTGEWLMVCGPHPLSTGLRPMFFANWYRVLAVDENVDDNDIPTGSYGQRRYVSLRGPQWPWQPASSLRTTSELSNNLCVIITPGAVAVHNRKIRLEGNSVWSSN
jgi:hypothetical protein